MPTIDKNFVRDLLIHEIELREMSLTDLRLSISRLEYRLGETANTRKEKETDNHDRDLLNDRLDILKIEERKVCLEIKMLEDAVKKV